jgi:HK97 gp10 family phage protein
MADIEFKLEGMEAVIRKMRALPVDVRKKGARFAGRKAANLVRQAAIQNATKIDDPQTREQIAKNVAVRFANRESRRSGDVVFRVGVLGGARQYANTKHNVRQRRVGKTYRTDGDWSNPGGDTFYWRFLEFGTQKVAARPFMRPALEQNVGPVADEFARQMNGWLDRYFRRQGIDPSSV